MTFDGRRSRGRNSVIHIALPECFRLHFVYCFRCLHQVGYAPGVDCCGNKSAMHTNSKDSLD